MSIITKVGLSHLAMGLFFVSLFIICSACKTIKLQTSLQLLVDTSVFAYYCIIIPFPKTSETTKKATGSKGLF